MNMGSNTTNLHVCSAGHDWQAVERAMTGLAVLVVCRRCAASRWVGGEHSAKDPNVAYDRCIDCGFAMVDHWRGPAKDAKYVCP